MSRMRCTTNATVPLFVGVAVLLTAAPALAHHPMGGATPETFFHGLLSGIGHPIIGIDHLAFVVAVGLVSAFTRVRLAPPAAFVAATVGGCALIVAGIGLPATELVITASVVLLGVAAMLGRSISIGALVAVVAVAGLFHGWAYGEAIVGAETAPLAAYLIGFAIVQFTIAAGVAWVVSSVLRYSEASAVQPRLAGAVVAGIGVALFVETVEAMLFV